MNFECPSSTPIPFDFSNDPSAAENEVFRCRLTAIVRHQDLRCADSPPIVMGKRLSLAVSPFARVWGMMVWWSPCRSREIVSAIGDRGHDPSKSIQIYPVDGVGGMAGFSLSATFQGSKSSMRAIL